MRTEITDRELRVTAPTYARQGAAKYLKEHGRLPVVIGGLWNYIPQNLVLKERGPDLVLTDDEQLVYDAIMRESRLPGGVTRLVERRPTDTVVLWVEDSRPESDSERST